MSSAQEPNREAVVILENDEGILELLLHPGFAKMLKTEGIDSELVILENIDALRRTIAEKVKVACLVTDLGGVGWGALSRGGIDGILAFNAEQGIQAPVLITTGTNLFYVLGSSTEAELNTMGISFLQKPYSLGKLTARIKLLINAARSR